MSSLGDDKGKPQGTRPSFTTKPAIKQVGGKIIFDCKVTADPKPTITWMKGTQALTDGGRYKMIQTGDKNNYDVSMEIDKPGKDDGGEYKCLAKNSLGDSTATITLNFEGMFKFLKQIEDRNEKSIMGRIICNCTAFNVEKANTI